MSQPERSPSRLSTSDLIGPTVIFVGTFLLAVTIALPTLLVDGLRTIPLSTDVTTVSTSATGPGNADRAQILDRCSLNTPTARTVGADLIRQQRMVAVQPSDADRVTLQVGTSVQAEHLWLDGRETPPDAPRPGAPDRPADDNRPADTPNPGDTDSATACTDATVSAVKDRVTLDRSTALPDLAATAGTRGNSEIQYDNNRPPVAAPDRRGYTYVLPFGVTGSGRQFFDVTTRRTVPLVDGGETQVGGRSALRFTADVPDTDLALTGSGDPAGTPPTRITRPASWFDITGGDPARPVTASLHHRARWELAVDEATGTILDERVAVDQTYRFADPALADRSLTALRATFAYDRDTQRALSALAERLGTPVTLWGRVVPLITGVLAVLAIAAGCYLIAPAWWRSRLTGRRRSPQPAPSGPGDPSDPASGDRTPSS